MTVFLVLFDSAQVRIVAVVAAPVFVDSAQAQVVVAGVTRDWVVEETCLPLPS